MEEEKVMKSEKAKMIDSIGWGVFLIWLGIMFITDAISGGIGGLGIGIIILGVMITRLIFGIKASGFILLIGALFLAGGLSELFGVKFPILSVLLIIAGALMILSRFMRKKRLPVEVSQKK